MRVCTSVWFWDFTHSGKINPIASQYPAAVSSLLCHCYAKPRQCAAGSVASAMHALHLCTTASRYRGRLPLIR